MSMREAGLRVTASLGSQAHGPDRTHQELAPEGSGNVPGSVPHDPAWRPHFPARHMARAWVLPVSEPRWSGGEMGCSSHLPGVVTYYPLRGKNKKTKNEKPHLMCPTQNQAPKD